MDFYLKKNLMKEIFINQKLKNIILEINDIKKLKKVKMFILTMEKS